MKTIIGWLISGYRRSPLYPHFGRFFASILASVLRQIKGDLFVYEAPDFRINIDLEQHIDTKIYFTGIWEPETVETIDKLLPRGGVAVDVGANIGFLTLRMALQAGDQGKVIAFEPTNWTFARLESNMKLNDLPQIDIVHQGLSNETATFELAGVPYGYRLDGKIVTTKQVFAMTTLDEYLGEHPVERLDFIKCDTDGNEEKVFLGAINSLEKFHPALHFELYQDEKRENAESSERLLKFLEGLGYSFFSEGNLSPYGDVNQVIGALKPLKQCVNVVAIAK